MDNSCFYYGANTADGVHSGIFEPEKIEKILVVKGGSPELKDKIFIELSEELVQKSIQNEMLFSFENCCGIYCAEEKILIADEKILKEKQIESAELNMKAFDACERLAVIVDKTGAVSTMIIDRLRRYALGSGYDVVSCICSLDGKTVEHIIVPELSFGAFSSEHYHRILPKKERRVFASRFHTMDSELYKNRINFSLKAYRSLMNEAFESLIGAQTEERKINYIFGNIVDVYDAVTEIIESI